MNIKVISFSTCLFFLSFMELQAQYSIMVSSDSVTIAKDSVIFVVDDYRGDLNWQVSKDSILWNLIDAAGDSLEIKIDSNAFFRAQLIEGTCKPVFSDIVQIKEKAIHTDKNYFTADSSGGVYYLPNGIKIKIPPGAIDSTLFIRTEVIDSITCYDALPPQTDIDRLFLGSIDLGPNDVVLKKPLKIKIPVNNYGPGNLFVVTGYDPLLFVPMNYHGYFIVSLTENYVEYVTNRLVPIRIEAIPITGNKSLSKNMEEKNDTTDCRKGVIIVKDEQTDFVKYFKPKTSSGGGWNSCETPSSESEITFVDCGKLKESFYEREISSGCIPEMELTIDNYILKTGQSVQAKVTLKIGDFSLANQKLNFVYPNSISISRSDDYTGKDGTLTFTVTANTPDSKAYIECSSQTQYHRQVIVVSSGTSTHRWHNLPESKYCSDKLNLICYDECTRPEELECSNLSATDCERVKQLLTDRIEIEPPKMALRKGSSFTYPVRAINYYGNYISETPTISWSSSKPLVADVVNGKVTAFNSGKALINAKWCNSQEQNEVFVGDLCDSANYVIDNSTRKLFLRDHHRIQAYCEFLNPNNNYAPDIHWKSTNAKVADVDSGGYITARNFGEASIIASWCDTSVTIPVSVQPKKEVWSGEFTTGYEDYCAKYYCSIVFDLTISWDSLKNPGYSGASGGISGVGNVYPQLIQLKDCSPYRLYYASPEFTLDVEGAAWKNSGEVLIKFPGYYGYWKRRKCTYEPCWMCKCESFYVEEDEEYHDLVPNNNQTINVKGKTEIDMDINYRFGFNCAGGNCVPYAYDVLGISHIHMKRVWCNYQ